MNIRKEVKIFVDNVCIKEIFLYDGFSLYTETDETFFFTFCKRKN